MILKKNRLIKYPEKLSFCIYMSACDKMLALKDTKIIIFDHKQEIITDTGIEYKIVNKEILAGFYYMNDTHTIYLTKKRQKSLVQLLWSFVLDVPQPFYWYKYDIELKTKILLETPFDYPIVLGSK